MYLPRHEQYALSTKYKTNGESNLPKKNWKKQKHFVKTWGKPVQKIGIKINYIIFYHYA